MTYIVMLAGGEHPTGEEDWMVQVANLLWPGRLQLVTDREE